MQHLKRTEVKLQKWKEKAILRGKKVNELRRSLRRAVLSRDRWKSECIALRREVKSGQGGSTSACCFEFGLDRPFGHQYPFF